MFRRLSIEFLTVGKQQIYYFIECLHFLKREVNLSTHGKQLEEIIAFYLLVPDLGFEHQD